VERPSTDLGWYVERLRELMRALNAPSPEDVLFGEDVEHGEHGLPCGLGKLTSLDDYRPRFADLLSRRWNWINLQAVGILGKSLVVSVELPRSPGASSLFTSVNISGPTRAVIGRDFDLKGLVERGNDAG
jgi:hypothetical protein